jgi:hypothetical protein
MQKTAPPEDEFDVIYREAWFVPGFFLLWVAIVRGWRFAARSVMRRRQPTG